MIVSSCCSFGIPAFFFNLVVDVFNGVDGADVHRSFYEAVDVLFRVVRYHRETGLCSDEPRQFVVATKNSPYIVEASVFWAAMCCHRGNHHGHHQPNCFCVTLLFGTHHRPFNLWVQNGHLWLHHQGLNCTRVDCTLHLKLS